MGSGSGSAMPQVKDEIYCYVCPMGAPACLATSDVGMTRAIGSEAIMQRQRARPVTAAAAEAEAEAKAAKAMPKFAGGGRAAGDAPDEVDSLE